MIVKWLGKGTEKDPFILDLPGGTKYKFIGSSVPILNGEVEVEIT